LRAVALGVFHGRKLDSEAHRFLSLTRYAQSGGERGRADALWIDANKASMDWKSSPAMWRMKMTRKWNTRWTMN